MTKLVRDLMHRGLITCRQNAALGQLAVLLYQHHEELGFGIEVEVEDYPDKKKKKTPEAEVNPELRAVEILIHEGKT
ncbi:MAG: hypothetical protein ACK2T0_07885, partial [Anaerolineales bacterium]